jgi:hypothetical protein
LQAAAQGWHSFVAGAWSTDDDRIAGSIFRPKELEAELCFRNRNPATLGVDAQCEEDGMKKSDECSRKIAGLMELAERYGVKVKESSVGSIGFVGGVRRPEVKSVDNDKPAGSPKPCVN